VNGAIGIVEAPVDEMTWRRIAALLGLGLRGRLVVVGVEQVRAAASKGDLQLAIVADDASAHSRKKVEGVLRARHVTVVDGVTAAALGSAVDRETTAAVGVLDEGLAAGIRGHVASRKGADGERSG